ncbi:MAG: hypothetical protein EHM89_17645, partial [Acidobacteria bacterium]
MTTRCLLCASAILALPLLQPHVAAQSPPALTIVSAGPSGETSALEQANEIRAVFSEPMVVLGRIPQPVMAPFFRITPAVAGTFRWSGTTILIFTPDPRRKLPHATRFDVTVDVSATAVSGRRLAVPYTFTFTTPTVKLLAANWYRKSKRYDSPMVIALRFNQPVRATDVAAHATLRFEKRDWEPPEISAHARARLNAIEPQALARFSAKVEAARRAASATGGVSFVVATDWDTVKFPRSPDLVVLEATTAVPPESRVRVAIDQRTPGLEGREVPAGPQSFALNVEPTFFIRGFRCGAECDPDRWNPLSFSRDVETASVQKAMTVTDITDPKQEKRVAPTRTITRRDGGYYPSVTSLEDVGFARQPPARTYAVRLDPGLQSADDGQTLGYTWLGIVDNWHARAFSSFGDGHGVWESSGGLRLPFSSRNLQDVTEWAVPIAPSQLMPRIQDLENRNFRSIPPGAGFRRSLRFQPDRIEAHGLDLSRAMTQGARTGLIWAGVREGQPMARSKATSDTRERSTIVQVTNLGVHVKDSNQNSLVFVSRLDNGAPVA